MLLKIKKCLVYLFVSVIVGAYGNVHAGNTSSVVKLDTNGVSVKSSSGKEIVFPYYCFSVSTKLNKLKSKSELIKLNYSSELLSTLNHCLYAMGKAARSTKGKELRLDQISETTLFVNQLVQKEVTQFLPPNTPSGNEELGKLCLLAHKLNIKPLERAFSFHIVERIYPVQEKISTALIEKGFGQFTESQVPHLRKYMRLKDNHKKEKSVSDHIALNGQPIVDEYTDDYHDVIHLEERDITSLDGINLVEEIYNGSIFKSFLRLNHNYILDCDVDPDFPSEPFSESTIYRLNLSDNFLTKIPDFFFSGADKLKAVDLSYNYLSPLNQHVISKFKTFLFEPQKD